MIFVVECLLEGLLLLFYACVNAAMKLLQVLVLLCFRKATSGKAGLVTRPGVLVLVTSIVKFVKLSPWLVLPLLCAC